MGMKAETWYVVFNFKNNLYIYLYNLCYFQGQIQWSDFLQVNIVPCFLTMKGTYVINNFFPALNI